MFIHTTRVEPKQGYRLDVSFNNGTSGEVDLSGELWGEVFEPLNDPAMFATARHDEVMGTVVWSNGADFAPEFLLSLLNIVIPAYPRVLPSGAGRIQQRSTALDSVRLTI